MVHIIPFLIEVVGDALLIRKGKKDISFTWRCVMVAVASIWAARSEFLAFLVTVDVGVGLEVLKSVALTSTPFFFFDNVLAWARGKRGLDYQGQTKWYDRVLMKAINKKLNPRVVLLLRGVGAAGLLYFGLT